MEKWEADAWSRVEEDRTRMLYRQAPGAAAVTLVASLGLLAAHARLVDARTVAWEAAMLVLVGVRVLLAARFPAAPLDWRSCQPWDRAYAAVVLLTGALFAIWPILFFRDTATEERLLACLVFGGMAGGSMALLAPRRWLALSYGALLLLPGGIALLAIGGTFERIAGVLACVYWLAMFLAVTVTHRNVVDAMLLSRSNQHLLEETDRQRSALAHANDELERTKAILEDNNRDLEQRIATRTRDLERLAAHDGLTGLANRARLTELARGLLTVDAPPLALHFLDLDGFKEINDTLGHAVGDAVLQEVAERLTRVASAAVALARWGGDEFVTIVPRQASVEDDLRFADDLLAALRMPMQHDALALRVDGCIGVAFWPEDGVTLDALIHGADLAVYAAKAAGSGQVRRYADEFATVWRRRAAIKHALGQAIAARDPALRLDYQPVHDARTRRVVSAEALLRWTDPVLGAIEPAEFIPLAEQNGDILALGEVVLQAGCRFAASLPEDRLPAVAVNVSAQQLRHPGFVATIERALAVSGLDPRRLSLELTESAFAIDAVGLEARMRELGRLGISFAIDDFGTGYSSLAYLQRLPARTLKIDRSFVSAIDGSGRPIVEAAVSLAVAFGLEVVAEGVEHEAQLDTLLALGVHRVQGYLLGRPMAADQLREQLAASVAVSD